LENDSPTVGCILCAVRGGNASQRTIERALEVARERAARLVFLYVIDAEFLGYATVGRPSVMLRELRTTGEFTMNILIKRLRDEGIDADAVVRTGDVRRQIIESVRWQDADLLIIGQPAKSPGRSTFTPTSLKKYVADVKAKTGVEVLIVDAPDASGEASGPW
jgi:nucleotide-binding universal stress UspA family protein